MLIEILLFLFLGIIAGTFTGLTPGIHINLIGALLVSSTIFLTKINPYYTLTFIVAMAITHTFLDFIPSIFLGCPDTDTELSVLPGHDLLKQGKGYEAVLLTAYGSLAAVFILIVLAYPAIGFFKFAQSSIQNYLPYILIAISFLLILTEKQKLRALFVFALSGLLGFIVLNSTINQPLFPLLTGLFGSSMLIVSVKNKTKIPEQSKPENFKPKLLKPILAATIAAPLCSFLPGLGSGQAAVIGNTIINSPEKDVKDFLILIGATNTLVMGFSFISLYAISKTRTGAAASINQIFGALNGNSLSLIVGIIFITGIISFYLTKFVARKASENITKIDYTKISLTTIIVLTIMVLIISGLEGILILAAATLLGIYVMNFEVKKTNMMGSIIIPVILFYLI